MSQEDEDSTEMAMLTKIAKDIEGLECIKKMCEKTKVPQELKEKMFSIYKYSIERKPVFAIASFAIALEENVGGVEDGLVDNVIYQMLREFDVTPDDYDCAKSYLMGGDQEADAGER